MNGLTHTAWDLGENARSTECCVCAVKRSKVKAMKLTYPIHHSWKWISCNGDFVAW